VLTQAAAQLVVAGAPGVTVLVRKPGKTIRFARGVANRTTSAPLQSRQPFRIGSITKTFVATVVLQSRAREL
jgi:D-alanyl-D-alanine carboxypeptidase